MKLRLTILILSFRLALISQDIKTELQAHSWFWTGNINDSIPIVLTSAKPKRFDFIADFKASYRLILTSQTNERIDSIFSYATNRNYLVLGYENKDSLENVTLIATISEDKTQIILKRISHIKSTYIGRDTISYDYFWLSKGRRTRDIFRHDEIIVYSKTDASGKFSERTQGDFYKVRGDSLFIDTEQFTSEYASQAGRNTASRYLKSIQLQNITTFYHERKKLNEITGWGIGLSVMSTLIVAPLVSIQKSGFNGNRYYKVAGTSLASTAIFITLRISLSHKKMVIKNKRNSWKIW